MPTKAELEDEIKEHKKDAKTQSIVIECLEASIAALSDKLEELAEASVPAPSPAESITGRSYLGAVQTPSTAVLGDVTSMAQALREPVRGSFVVDYKGPGAAAEVARQRVFRHEELADGTLRIHYQNSQQASQEARRAKILRGAEGDDETRVKMTQIGSPDLKVIDAARGGVPVIAGGVLSFLAEHVNVFAVCVGGKDCLLLELN